MQKARAATVVDSAAWSDAVDGLSAEQRRALVTAVADYPKFLPWCDRAEILEETPDGMTARLGLAYAGIRQT